MFTRKLTKIMLLIFLLGSWTMAYATIIHVPADYETIQAAIEAAEDGDTVLVADGVHFGEGNRDIDFKGKAITLKSENGPEKTIIHCYNSARGFIFQSGEDKSSVLRGFTIKDGRAVGSNGGAIYIENSSPTIENNIIMGNSGDHVGGGIYCGPNSSPSISNNIITGNFSDRREGGGIYCNNSSPSISNNIITGNSGNGIECGNNSSPTISNNTIVNNDGPGIKVDWTSDETLVLNTIIWGNKGSQVVEEISIIYSDVQGGWDDIGNIDADPLFVDPENGNYHLQTNSPCIDAGSPGARHNDKDGSRNDMGAYGGPNAIETWITCIKGDVTGDGLVKSIDATFALRVAAGLIEPTEKQRCAADMNNDEEIKSIDASLILRKAAGLDIPAPAAPALIASINRMASNRLVTIAELQASPGTTVTVPVKVDDATELIAADLTIAYDSSVLSFEKVELGSLTTDFNYEVNSKRSDRLVIPLSAREPLVEGSGSLIEITFKVDSDVPNGSKTEIDLSEIWLWDVNAQKIKAQIRDGSITIWDPLSERQITTSDTSAQKGSSVVIPVAVDNATDLISADFEFSYDESILQYQGAVTTELSKDFEFTVNSETPGKLIIPMSAKQPIESGSGSLFELTFSVSRDVEVGTQTELQLNNAVLWTSKAIKLPVKTTNGNITISKDIGGVSGTFPIDLRKGLNMVSLPVKPQTPYTAKTFAEKMGASVIIKYDRDNQKFVPYVPEHSTSEGFAIDGGEGYIVNVVEGKKISFTGTVWDNTAAPISINDSGTVWAFVVAGNLPIELRNSGNLMISVRNVERNIHREFQQSHSKFSIAFVNSDRTPVVKAKDVLEISVKDADGQLVAEQNITVKTKDLAKAFVIVNPRYNPIPKSSVLLQNYPNPFNPETWIPFKLAEGAKVSILIYDVAGRIIRTLRLGELPAGVYTSKNRAAYWDGRSDTGEEVASGVYFYTINAGNFRSTRRMVIIR